LISVQQETASPTLLLHAIDDGIIPHSHSAALFASLHKSDSQNTSAIREITHTGWGVVRSFLREGKGEVVWCEGLSGGHDDVAWAEGSLDLIQEVAKL